MVDHGALEEFGLQLGRVIGIDPGLRRRGEPRGDDCAPTALRSAGVIACSPIGRRPRAILVVPVFVTNDDGHVTKFLADGIANYVTIIAVDSSRAARSAWIRPSGGGHRRSSDGGRSDGAGSDTGGGLQVGGKAAQELMKGLRIADAGGVNFLGGGASDES
jgi:hypothetical protein